jgi:hypothetical protein
MRAQSRTVLGIAFVVLVWVAGFVLSWALYAPEEETPVYAVMLYDVSPEMFAASDVEFDGDCLTGTRTTGGMTVAFRYCGGYMAVRPQQGN